MKFGKQLILSVLSGVLVCLSFPTLIAGIHLPEMGFLAWFALVPLITAFEGAGARRAYVLAFISGLVWSGGSLFWIFRAVHTFGSLPAVQSAIIQVLLVVFVAAFTALAPMVAKLISSHARGPARHAFTGGEFMVWLPASWTAMEFLRGHIPSGGFPWSNIAMSQWQIPILIQIADLTGVYGVVFLIIWFNVFIAELVKRIGGKQVDFFVPKAVVTGVLIAATLGYGFVKIDNFPSSLKDVPSMSVGIIQGNIPQEDKWQNEMAVANLNTYRKKARDLMESSVELIVWPEAAFPWQLSTDKTDIEPLILGLASGGTGDVPYTLFGAVSENNDGDYFNSAILFDGQGRIAGRYHKAHLVPFGEYIPAFARFFFFKKLTEPAGNFKAGESFEPLAAGPARFGVLICYEDIFPEISRDETREGADFLVNITNDAWYGMSSAPYQHLALSVFRAVENRRFLVRATNTGVSAVVLPTGRIIVRSGIFEPAVIVSPVALLKKLTPYTKLGDWFALACTGYVIIGLGICILSSSRKRGSSLA